MEVTSVEASTTSMEAFAEAFAEASFFFHGRFHNFHESFHGSGGSFHGSFYKLPRKKQVVQETAWTRRVDVATRSGYRKEKAEMKRQFEESRDRRVVGQRGVEAGEG